MRIIHCVKLQRELEGLERPPIPGNLGDKIFNHISKTAWSQWLNHQTMLINEYRLSLVDVKSRTFLMEEMDKFLFGTGSAAPPGYVEEK